MSILTVSRSNSVKQIPLASADHAYSYAYDANRPYKGGRTAQRDRFVIVSENFHSLVQFPKSSKKQNKTISLSLSLTQQMTEESDDEWIAKRR
jgi:hypothetical protein